MESNGYTDLINTFTFELRFALDLKKSLYLALTEYPLFSDGYLDLDTTITYKQSGALDDLQETYDYVLGDLPLGMRREEWTDNQNQTVKVRKNWLFLLRSLFLLSSNGCGLYVVEPALGSAEWSSFCEVLGDRGFYVNAAFNTPEGIFRPYTSIRPVLVLISRKKSEGLFVAELDTKDTVAAIVDNYSRCKSGGSLDVGVIVPPDDFKGFDQYKLRCQIEKLESQYKSYKRYSILDVAKEITLGKQDTPFAEKENSIYLPRVGNSPVISDLQRARIKHQNYIQVVLDASVVNNVYAELFFTSELGLLMLRSLYQGAVIPKLNKQQLENCVLAIPDMQEQQRIVDTHRKLMSLEQKIDAFRSELSINPSNANKINLSVDELLNQLDMLSEADQIRSIIRKGESKTVEFKQSLEWDVKNDKHLKQLNMQCLKTIVAFLNTDGGTLLVGVDDNGTITGMDHEISKLCGRNTDKFLLKFKNLLKERIGEGFYPLIDYSLVGVDNTSILQVACSPSESACYLDAKDFYVRTNPATDKLEGPKLVEYVKRHFH